MDCSSVLECGRGNQLHDAGAQGVSPVGCGLLEVRPQAGGRLGQVVAGMAVPLRQVQPAVFFLCENGQVASLLVDVL